jgi:hypothetical protein
MKSKGRKIIAAIGLRDEETAHLRLMMRSAANVLTNPWGWGSEATADLIVVDPASFAGQVARSRAAAAGLRCAVFREPGPGPDGELVLHRPLRVANVIDLLNRVAADTDGTAGVAIDRDPFVDASASAAPSPVEARTGEGLLERRRSRTELGELDALLKSDALRATSQLEVPVPWQLRVAALVPDNPEAPEQAPSASARSEARRQDQPNAFGKTVSPPAPAAASSMLRGAVVDATAYELREYLAGSLLGGPAVLQLGDAPPLVVDPKVEVFHTPESVGALAPYCTKLRICDWRALTSAELADIRGAQAAQPYERLLWLDAFLRSGEQLARHFDLGGTFQLTRLLGIEHENSRRMRIAAAMKQSARVDEIAAASDAPIGEVFRVINAYSAIGLVEHRPRPPREIPEPERGIARRLLGRLGSARRR